MKNGWMFWLITITVIGWGLILAIGSYLGGDKLQHDMRRGAVVFGCVVAFLGFWWTMLAARKRRLEAENFTAEDAEYSEKN